MSRRKNILMASACIVLGMALAGPAAHAAEEVLTAIRSTHQFYLDGERIELEAYLINGNNYVKLADVGEALDFNVYWDGAVRIESAEPYTGRATESASTPEQARQDIAALVNKGQLTPKWQGAFTLDLGWRRLSFYTKLVYYTGHALRNDVTPLYRNLFDPAIGFARPRLKDGSFKKDFSDRYSLMANAKYAYDYLHYLADPRRDEALMYVNNHYYQHEVYASVANRYSILPVWDISLSADYQFNLLNADLTDFVYPHRHTELLAFATALHLDRFKAQASVLGTFVQDHTRTGAKAADNKMEWTPTAIVSWQPFGDIDLNLRAFYKRIFRMPTLNDLYYTFIGNIELDPEYTNQYNIGVTYAKEFKRHWLRRLEVQADAYYNEVQNKIVAMPTSNFFRWTMVNLGEVEIRGVDVAAQADWQWGEDWRLAMRVNYTYQKAQDFTDPSDTYYGDQIPYIPWHSGSATAALTWRTWEANYSFIYTGERYSSRANIPANYVLPWYTSDLSLSKLLHAGPGDLKLTLEVNNLLNQQYEVVICYPMPGINFKAIVQYTF